MLVGNICQWDVENCLGRKEREQNGTDEVVIVEFLVFSKREIGVVISESSEEKIL